MKSVLFTLAAMAVATTAAAQQPRHVQSWVDGAREQITQAAAAEATAPGTAVDQAVLRAAKKVRADQLPNELVGRAVTLQIAVAPAGAVQAASTVTQVR